MNYSKILFLAFIASLCFGFTQSNKSDIKWFTKTGKITFFSSTPVEDIKAVNNQVVVAFTQESGSIAAKATIKSFIFKKKLMQEHFNENYMESDKYPNASYLGKIDNIKAVNFSKDSTYKVTTSGALTIHGVTKNITTSGTLKVEGNRATINAEFDVLLKDYNIKKPSVVAMKIADKIKVTLNASCDKKI